MAKHGKSYLAAKAKIDPEKLYSPREAMDLAKETSSTKFDSTVEVHIRTALDPRQADQQVRDVVVLPHGLGKTVRVLVFAQGEAMQQPLAVAIIAGLLVQIPLVVVVMPLLYRLLARF